MESAECATASRNRVSVNVMSPTEQNANPYSRCCLTWSFIRLWLIWWWCASGERHVLDTSERFHLCRSITSLRHHYEMFRCSWLREDRSRIGEILSCNLWIYVDVCVVLPHFICIFLVRVAVPLLESDPLYSGTKKDYTTTAISSSTTTNTISVIATTTATTDTFWDQHTSKLLRIWERKSRPICKIEHFSGTTARRIWLLSLAHDHVILKLWNTRWWSHDDCFQWFSITSFIQ